MEEETQGTERESAEGQGQETRECLESNGGKVW